MGGAFGRSRSGGGPGSGNWPPIGGVRKRSGGLSIVPSGGKLLPSGPKVSAK